MAHPRPQVLIYSLPAEVQETIANARAPITRKLYSSKWRDFESWYLAHAVDSVNCPIGPELEFLQERIEVGVAATTLRVYVAATSFRSQVVTLHSFHPPPFASGEDERLHMLCPVRALKIYVDHSSLWRQYPQLLVCFGTGRRGLATSKHRIYHWVKDALYRWLMRCVVFIHLSAFGRILLGVWLPLKLFSEGFP